MLESVEHILIMLCNALTLDNTWYIILICEATVNSNLGFCNWRHNKLYLWNYIIHSKGDIQSEKNVKSIKEIREKGLTVPSMLKPFVHLTRFPEASDVCMTGKEKVKPSSLCLPGDTWKSLGSKFS